MARSPAAFAGALAQWFRQHRRVLPWREQPSAYKTVVSELMLQQTQVVTALPYFERWIARWPDFESLARAEESEVLQMWEGLGYYTRARNLLKLARAWVQAAQKPVSAAQWLSYPGVGPYTAAAIASIAFGEHAAVVDGNVVRILARLAADTTAYANAALAVKAMTPLAQTVITHAAEPGLHNEAMMELGATLCRKGQPQCLLCPVADFCAGRKLLSDVAELPRIARKKTENRIVNRALVLAGGGGDLAVLLERYGSDSRRLAGLCELPQWEAVARVVARAGALPRVSVTGAGATAMPTGAAATVVELPLEFASAPAEPLGEPLLVRRRGIANERIEERFYAFLLTRAASDEISREPEPRGGQHLRQKMATGETADAATAATGNNSGLFWQKIADLDQVTLTGPHRRWLSQLLKAGRQQ